MRLRLYYPMSSYVRPVGDYFESTLNQLVKTIGSSLKIKSVQTKNKSPDQSVYGFSRDNRKRSFP